MATPRPTSQWRPTGPAVAPRDPSSLALGQLNGVVRWGGWAARLGLRRWVERVEVQGREHLASGPLLLLSNHSCVFDPLLLTVFGRRPVQFLVTEPFMTGRVGRAASWFGQVPKRKLESDAHSFRLLKQWCEQGAAVGMFPEGQFPWDSRPLPLQPGLAPLVSYLGVPVVTARLLNADRLFPPWATHPRRTTVRLEFDAPRRFAPGEPVEALVRERIFVDPDTCPRWPARGRDLASGLARFLRYCLACGADGSLSDAGDALHCRSCQAHWRVSAENRLHGVEQSLTVAEARALSEAHWRAAWARETAFRSAGLVDLLDISRPETKRLAHGELALEGGRLVVRERGAAPAWSLEAAEILAHTMDWGERIVVRTRRARLALRLAHDSRALWTLALDTAMAASRSAA